MKKEIHNININIDDSNLDENEFIKQNYSEFQYWALKTPKTKFIQLSEILSKYKDFLNKNTQLEKHNVCTDCYSVGIIHPDCICSYSKYNTIELEFEVCNCCGNLVDDGSPSDTDFNKKQLTNNE